ncbi:HEAT repeat domain-containing protein [uncultured Methanoregula sp.]|uniref:HEAT repeat domain-containing protein n=1 Tax=uncultured Methanoregula sp. TaxID=1005933 RepID=UPI002AAB750C|nr:HEAT repeat domain-containing protein [uncultured Methanoregula sp.]
MAEKINGELYSTFPRRGAVYDLTYTALSGRTTEERLQAIIMLGKSDDPRAVRPLIDLLCDSDPAIRCAAATSLGLLKSGRSVEALLERLRDRNEAPEIRYKAIAALATIRSTGALRGLREFVLETGEDANLRSFAGDYISRLGTW